MTDRTPFLLSPAGKDYLWGGTRLKTEYGKKLPMEPLAETWECSAHPDGLSIVSGGRFDGKTLREVLSAHPAYLGAHSRHLGDLPILVKYIDAAQDLSVQVHPDDAYALTHEGQPGKTEMWYVVDAAPGAKLVWGFAHDVTPTQLRAAIAGGSLQKHLNRVDVKAGDVFFIPPGTVHAIGAGTLLVEIQQSSNVTYRLYDYDRTDQNGRQRPLHIDKALDVLQLKRSVPDKRPPRLIRHRPGCAYEIIGRCQYFQTERFQISTGCTLTVKEDSFHVLLCIGGAGMVCCEQESISVQAGSCVFCPAGAGDVTLQGRMEVLRIRC